LLKIKVLYEFYKTGGGCQKNYGTRAANHAHEDKKNNITVSERKNKT
jgi:hypothetical protein